MERAEKLALTPGSFPGKLIPIKSVFKNQRS